MRMCEAAGVKLLPLAPYLPDMNLIKELFAELKDCVKNRWDEHIGVIERDFRAYVLSCIELVGSRQLSAEGHFRKAGLSVEQPPTETP